jgi:hypothetical protein
MDRATGDVSCLGGEGFEFGTGNEASQHTSRRKGKKIIWCLESRERERENGRM